MCSLSAALLFTKLVHLRGSLLHWLPQVPRPPKQPLFCSGRMHFLQVVSSFTKEIRLRFESSHPSELLNNSMPSSRVLALASLAVRKKIVLDHCFPACVRLPKFNWPSRENNCTKKTFSTA